MCTVEETRYPLLCKLTWDYPPQTMSRIFSSRKNIYTDGENLQKTQRVEIPGKIRLHNNAIWTAVPSLSPVSIQKFIPDFLRQAIASGTPSYNIMMERLIKKKNFISRSIADWDNIKKKERKI